MADEKNHIENSNIDAVGNIDIGDKNIRISSDVTLPYIVLIILLFFVVLIFFSIKENQEIDPHIPDQQAALVDIDSVSTDSTKNKKQHNINRNYGSTQSNKVIKKDIIITQKKVQLSGYVLTEPPEKIGIPNVKVIANDTNTETDSLGHFSLTAKELSRTGSIKLSFNHKEYRAKTRIYPGFPKNNITIFLSPK